MKIIYCFQRYSEDFSNNNNNNNDEEKKIIKFKLDDCLFQSSSKLLLFFTVLMDKLYLYSSVYVVLCQITYAQNVKRLNIQMSVATYVLKKKTYIYIYMNIICESCQRVL